MRNCHVSSNSEARVLVISFNTERAVQVASEYDGMAYIFDGSGTVGGTKGSKQQALVFGAGDHLTASTDDPKGMRCVSHHFSPQNI